MRGMSQGANGGQRRQKVASQTYSSGWTEGPVGCVGKVSDIEGAHGAIISTNMTTLISFYDDDITWSLAGVIVGLSGATFHSERAGSVPAIGRGKVS